MNEYFKLNIPKSSIDLLNQLFEVERKLESIKESNTISRNLNKMKAIFENSFQIQQKQTVD